MRLLKLTTSKRFWGESHSFVLHGRFLIGIVQVLRSPCTFRQTDSRFQHRVAQPFRVAEAHPAVPAKNVRDPVAMIREKRHHGKHVIAHYSGVAGFDGRPVARDVSVGTAVKAAYHDEAGMPRQYLLYGAEVAHLCTPVPVTMRRLVEVDIAVKAEQWVDAEVVIPGYGWTWK